MLSADRFDSKRSIDLETGCWNWTGSIDRYGYGRFRDGARNGLAHRFAYELLVGPIPSGLTLDHLCRNRACVNPVHLDPVTGRENNLRGFGAAAMHARQTLCVNGHPFDEANTYRRRGKGRTCRACNSAAVKRYMARRADA